MLTQVWNSKITFLGASFSLSNIPANLKKVSPVVSLIACALFVDTVKAHLETPKNIDCEKFFQEQKTIASSTLELVKRLIEVGCLSLENKATGKPLSVANKDTGACSDPENCITFTDNGMHAAINTNAAPQQPKFGH